MGMLNSIDIAEKNISKKELKSEEIAQKANRE